MSRFEIDTLEFEFNGPTDLKKGSGTGFELRSIYTLNTSIAYLIYVYIDIIYNHGVGCLNLRYEAHGPGHD